MQILWYLGASILFGWEASCLKSIRKISSPSGKSINLTRNNSDIKLAGYPVLVIGLPYIRTGGWNPSKDNTVNRLNISVGFILIDRLMGNHMN